MGGAWQELTTPVIHYNQPKDMLISILYLDTLPQFRRFTDHSSHLELKVDDLRRAKRDLGSVRAAKVLAQWPYDIRPRHHDRRSPPVVSDREVEEGGRQRPHPNHGLCAVRHVLLGAREVREARYLDWQMQLDLIYMHSMLGDHGRVGQEFLELSSQVLQLLFRGFC